MNYLPQPISDHLYTIAIDNNLESDLRSSLTYGDAIWLFKQLNVYIDVSPDRDFSTEEIWEDVWIANVFVENNFSEDHICTTFEEGVEWAIEWIYEYVDL